MTVAWASSHRNLVGTGDTLRFDPGTGAQRYRRALDWLRSTGRPTAIASFTFDPQHPGPFPSGPTPPHGHPLRLPTPGAGGRSADHDVPKALKALTVVGIPLCGQHRKPPPRPSPDTLGGQLLMICSLCQLSANWADAGPGLSPSPA